jgi:ribokinase
VRAAVVGHIEVVEFVQVESYPRPGEIVHALDSWTEAAGGGAVAAVQLVNLGAETSFFTALGNDELGRRAREELEARGVRLHVEWVEGPQRRGITYLDETGERTITVIGEKLRPRGDDASLPWEELHRTDGVYFTGGDVGALQKARHAGTLVATARELPTLGLGGVELDALVSSATDMGERYERGDLEPPPRVVVATSGRLGGWAQPGGPFAAAPLPGPIADTYGAGDCFAAGLTFALGRGDELHDALALAARCGATVVTGRGPYERQLRLDDNGVGSDDA